MLIHATLDTWITDKAEDGFHFFVHHFLLRRGKIFRVRSSFFSTSEQKVLELSGGKISVRRQEGEGRRDRCWAGMPLSASTHCSRCP